jgi:hypothetical protein
LRYVSTARFIADLLVVDTHPDNTHTLRIDRPFPALETYVKELNLDSMDSMEHSHVPWVVLLVKAALEWKRSVSFLESPEAYLCSMKDRFHKIAPMMVARMSIESSRRC